MRKTRNASNSGLCCRLQHQRPTPAEVGMRQKPAAHPVSGHTLRSMSTVCILKLVVDVIDPR